MSKGKKGIRSVLTEERILEFQKDSYSLSISSLFSKRWIFLDSVHSLRFPERESWDMIHDLQV